nr:hypothetical protein [Mesorhizobium sp.]
MPVVVKPRNESTSRRLQLVHEPDRLRQAVEVIVTQYLQDALVEEYIEEREISVHCLETESSECCLWWSRTSGTAKRVL